MEFCQVFTSIFYICAKNNLVNILKKVYNVIKIKQVVKCYMNFDILKNCTLCPRKCGADRLNGETGYCKKDAHLCIARADLHFWEEPPISGTRGSGTVFFSGCNMGCVYCQNYKISTGGFGKCFTEDELAEEFLKLQNRGAHNINLVTPTHFTPQISSALMTAKKHGLKIPIVYNCGGYESTETIKMLHGLVNIYMPDVKYCDDKYAVKYSNAPNYFTVASQALREMYRQTGRFVLDSDGIMQSGMIIRHMLLPKLLFDSKKIIDWIYAEFGDNVYISIMSQYTPMPQAAKYGELSECVSERYYESLVNYAAEKGIVNAFTQSGDSVGESFIPPF